MVRAREERETYVFGHGVRKGVDVGGHLDLYACVRRIVSYRIFETKRPYRRRESAWVLTGGGTRMLGDLMSGALAAAAYCDCTCTCAAPTANHPTAPDERESPGHGQPTLEDE